MTRALYHARALAMNRMEEEAEALGADGIVGVRLEVNLSTNPIRMQRGARTASGKSGRGRTGFPRSRRDLERSWRRVAQPRGRAVGVSIASRWVGSNNAACAVGASRDRRPRYALGQNVAEFIAIGTAVRHRERRALPEQARQAVPVGSQRAGLLDADPLRLPARRLRDGQLRLLRAAAPAPGARDGQLRAHRVHPRALRRARARDRAPAGRGRGARRDRHRRRDRRGAAALVAIRTRTTSATPRSRPAR